MFANAPLVQATCSASNCVAPSVCDVTRDICVAVSVLFLLQGCNVQRLSYRWPLAVCVPLHQFCHRTLLTQPRLPPEPRRCRLLQGTCVNTVGASCAAANCCAGLSCHPILQQCLKSPREYLDFCVAGAQSPSRLGRPCAWGMPEVERLAAHVALNAPKPRRAYISAVLNAASIPGALHSPRAAGDPQADCGPGLKCHPWLKQCFHDPPNLASWEPDR